MPENPLAVEQVQRRYWPAYDVQSDLAGGTKRRGFTLHYTRLIALITFIAMVSWTISLLPKVRNHTWSARTLASAALLLLVALIAWQTPPPFGRHERRLEGADRVHGLVRLG